MNKDVASLIFKTIPKITFKVNTIDYSEIFENILPDNNFENIEKQFKEKTIYIPYVDCPLKHGDEFVLTGIQATKVKNMYINKKPKILEILKIESIFVK